MLVKAKVLSLPESHFRNTVLPAVWAHTQIKDYSLNFYVLTKEIPKIMTTLDVVSVGACVVQEIEDPTSPPEEIFIGLNAPDFTKIDKPEMDQFIKKTMRFISKHYKIIGVLEEAEAEKLIINRTSLVVCKFP